ncbi:nickel-responsive transcriptional regulator NikR [candidate division KSB1 bacterium]|nr:nickel-responsive transcriptional regulator NikR [candidate division KSB1 bacterium]
MLVRFGISLDDELLQKFDRLIHRKKYKNRSEAIRDLIRAELIADEWAENAGDRVATLTLIYDHHRFDLAQKLVQLQHDSPAQVEATLHIHLDHHHCLEMLAIRGRARDIEDLADKLSSLKGVKHGQLVKTSASDAVH